MILFWTKYHEREQTPSTLLTSQYSILRLFSTNSVSRRSVNCPFISISNSIIPQNNSTRRFATELQDKEYSTWCLSTTHNITPTVKKNVVCSSSNRKLNFIKTYNNSKQNNQANQASLPSTSTKVASTIVSCNLQSRLWMLLCSGLPIAELTRTSLTDTWNRGTRGTEGHEEHEECEVKPKRNQCHGHTPQV